MLRKSGIIIVLLIAITALVMASASAASANEAPKIATKSGDGGYSISFDKTKASAWSAEPMSAMISNSISQGQTIWCYKTISGYTTSVSFNLYWGNPSNSLRMRIYTPDGYVYGPYYDNADGRYDGYIPAKLSRGSGVAQGTYYIEVYGDRVSGSQSFTLN